VKRRGRETYREKRKNKRKGNFERRPWKDHRMEKRVKKEEDEM
jgi:hypothetical protein